MKFYCDFFIYLDYNCKEINICRGGFYGLVYDVVVVIVDYGILKMIYCVCVMVCLFYKKGIGIMIFLLFGF